jgi:DNA-binding SARP family transcriptional activator
MASASRAALARRWYGAGAGPSAGSVAANQPIELSSDPVTTRMANVQVRLLGPVDVVVDGATCPVPGLRRKTVLAVLAVHGGEVVDAGRLVDFVWGEGAPRTAASTVQGHISYLRRVLGDRAAIIARPPGYFLDIDGEAVDVQVAERLVREGMQAVDHHHRARRLQAALALWRGRPLADLAGLQWADEQARRLDEVWLQATRALIETRMALGDHALVVSDLERLVRDHPFDEQIQAQLMLALYRAGRQNDGSRGVPTGAGHAEGRSRHRPPAVVAGAAPQYPATGPGPGPGRAGHRGGCRPGAGTRAAAAGGPPSPAVTGSWPTSTRSFPHRGGRGHGLRRHRSTATAARPHRLRQPVGGDGECRPRAPLKVGHRGRPDQHRQVRDPETGLRTPRPGLGRPRHRPGQGRPYWSVLGHRDAPHIVRADRRPGS